SMTGERERQTLDLLLTTTLSPWTILWGKLFSGLRVSSVLTLFLMWPVLLATLMPMPAGFWTQIPTMVGYLLIVLLTCATTSITALMTSIMTRKTSVSLMTSYLVIGLLFAGPVAAAMFSTTFFPGTTATAVVEWTQVTSPFVAAFTLPLSFDMQNIDPRTADVPQFLGYVTFALLYNVGLLSTMAWLLNVRWRVPY
ncbi:MAG: ABC transporter permease, partial [Pirellulales bacterium]